MTDKLKSIFPHLLNSVLNSYSQIFFSIDSRLAWLLLAVSFFDFYTGLSGLTAVMLTNMVAYLTGFNRNNIRSGLYGFNSLLVGLGMGIYYNPSLQFYTIIAFASLLTLFITLAFEGILGKYALPYLSLPFLFSVWMLTLASRQFSELEISSRGIFMLNEMYEIGGYPLVKAYNWFSQLNLPEPILLYFKSLGAIFFQYHLFAGMLIAAGILIYSRIAFLLSVTGFISAYVFYGFIGGNISDLSTNYIGFNFILTSMAIGGFFLVASPHSFFWVILLTPLISFSISGTMALLGMFQLPIYSLPFNFTVILFLYALKFRERFLQHPAIVIIQHFSPEKNLYSRLNYNQRFNQHAFIPVSLPFWGEWTVTQAHNGAHTHKDAWKHAWDFEILDEVAKSYMGNGNLPEDYYCYGKPVIAPADGWVEEIIDGIEDNKIADFNLEHNWGNTIVIRHAEGLYSKLSHLQKSSFKVARGAYIKKGDVLAQVGNSGRSPYPHLHFQIQATPFVGSKTLYYPITNYLTNNSNTFSLSASGIPAEKALVSNVSLIPNLEKAYHFVPGQILTWKVKSPVFEGEKEVIWEVMADIYNSTFLYEPETQSKAWFQNTGNAFYFTFFEGNKRSLLYFFFLANFKTIPGFYKDLQINDQLPLNIVSIPVISLIQDFFAPFYIFLHAGYTRKHLKFTDNFTSQTFEYSTEICIRIFRKTLQKTAIVTSIQNETIQKMIIQYAGKTVEAQIKSDK